MSMSRYEPWREALSLRNAMDQLFSQSFVNPRWLGEEHASVAPMDVFESDDGYQVRLALPGVQPDDIELTVHQNTLSVHAEYQTENQQGTEQASGQEQKQGQEQSKQGNWLMREIRSGSFQRSVTFDRPIDIDKVQTNYENGVLMVTLPISEASRPKKISVGKGSNGGKQVPVDRSQAQG